MYIDVHSNDVFDQFTSRIGSAQTVAELKALLEETVSRLGYQYFAYHIVQHSALYEGGSARQTYGIFSYPDTWMAQYVARQYVNHDPVVDCCLGRKTPFRWEGVIDMATLSPSQRQVMKEAAEAGIRDGLTIPLMSKHGEVAMLTVIPPKGGMEQRRGRKDDNLLYVIAQFFHAHALRIVMEERLVSNVGRRRSFLSARERETTLWVSRGKSSWEIAQILGISEKSVEFYMESVKKKLEAVNRTQAVVKAILLGLIDGENPIPAARTKSAPRAGALRMGAMAAAPA
ncbi:helix-turn-helix transcriptional regulator [Allorhizobium undicola]|uniref:helix-turn-helix transcriptional regulator n=1 Tax=Allorhizobium undicola TaxID=78527 RepID=UPI000687DA9B|nr:LuxR family transcriptional regulator [Allorhizobium undicola]